MGGSYALRVEPGAGPAAALRSAQALLRTDLAASRSRAGFEVRFTLDEPLARRLLERDNGIGADAKALFETHLRTAAARWETFKSWDVAVPLPIWDEYARDSRLSHTSISRCLSAAIRRDYDRRMAAAEPIDALRADIRAYHATQTQILEEVRELVGRLGDIQNIGLQLRRIAMHLKVAS